MLRENVIRPNMIWGAVKDLVGKDLTQVSLPVFINEPLTTLQKTAEMMVFSDKYLTQAIMQEDSTKRMLFVAVSNIAAYSLIKGRTAKPFNPLLGETYELVTSSFRFIAEQVSHHPPVLAFNCQG